MNFTKLFETLRTQKWAMYVPERIYRAHRDGLLHGWGVSERYTPRGRITTLVELLKEEGMDLKVPFMIHHPPDKADEVFLKVYADWLVTYAQETDCPPLPKSVIASDVFWDSLVSRFNLNKSLTNRVLVWDNWVYRVRFFKVWVVSGKLGLGYGPNCSLSNDERLEWYRERKKVRAERKVLRENYGLNSEYFQSYNTTRRPILAVIKKIYPPEQVRHVRRQFEEKLRKDPAEVIRYALERGLVK